jgi:hypothetical protein
MVVEMTASQKEAVVRFPSTTQEQAGSHQSDPLFLQLHDSVAGEKKEFAPGESGELVATYTPGARIGTQRNLITVETDDVTEKQAVLCVVAEIPVVMKLERQFLLWKETRSRDEEPRYRHGRRGAVERLSPRLPIQTFALRSRR